MMNKENETWVQKAVLNCLFLNEFLWKEKIDLAWVKFWAVELFLGLVLAYGFFWRCNHLSSFTYPRHYYTMITEYQLPPPPPHTHTHTQFCKRKRLRKGRFFFFSNALFRFKSTHVTGKIKFAHGSIALTSITQRLFHVLQTKLRKR